MSQSSNAIHLPGAAEDPTSEVTRGSILSELHNRAPWNNLVCGMLVFALRWGVPPDSFSVDWSLFFTGIAIMIVALSSMIAHGNCAKNYWSALNIVAGLWLVVSTTILPSVPTVTWAQVCLGILTISIALTSLANEANAAPHSGAAT